MSLTINQIAVKLRALQCLFPGLLAFAVLVAAKASHAQDCAYLPPGGPLAFGFLEMSQLNVESQAGDSPIWLDDGRVAVGAALSSQDGYRRGAIWIMKPYPSSLHDIQSFILPPLPHIKVGFGGFGRVLASSGPWLATSARLTNDLFTVCLLQATTATEWALRTNLFAAPPANSESFGASEHSIAMDDSWLAVLSYGFYGRVHLYQVNDAGTWALREQLVVPGFQSAELPSTMNVAMRERTLAVGVPRHNSSTYAGAVHVWRRDSAGAWIYQTNVASPDLKPGDRFGTSLALGPDRLFVGATQSDVVATDAGAIFGFQYENGVWSEFTRFSATNATGTTFVGANLGYSDLEGEWLVDASSGRFRLFRPVGAGNQWTQVAQGHSGRAFHNWESPAGTVKSYVYGPTNLAADFVSVRGPQALIGFNGVSSLMEYGWHSINVRHFEIDPPCSVRPVSYRPIGAPRGDGHDRMADTDEDGIADLVEMYFGTYGLTSSVWSGLTPLVENQTRKIRWPRSSDPNLPITAQPQWSSDLLQWTAEGLAPAKVAEDPATGREIMEVSLPDTRAAYFRLQLALPAP